MKPIKLSFKQLILLHDAFINKHVPYAGPHYDLLREHVADLAAKLDKMIDRGSANYRLKFTSLQALAFMQLWVNEPLPQTGAEYLIQDIISILDKSSKRPKRLQHENY